MEIMAIISTFKDIAIPVFGILVTAFLVTCIPGVAEAESIFDEED
jgi:hypothetical protein